jgi:hypothetical protein
MWSDDSALTNVFPILFKSPRFLDQVVIALNIVPFPIRWLAHGVGAQATEQLLRDARCEIVAFDIFAPRFGDAAAGKRR